MFINPTFYAIGHSAIENVGSAGNYINEVVMISLAHPKTQWPLKVRTAVSLHCASLRVESSRVGGQG